MNGEEKKKSLWGFQLFGVVERRQKYWIFKKIHIFQCSIDTSPTYSAHLK